MSNLCRILFGNKCIKHQKLVLIISRQKNTGRFAERQAERLVSTSVESVHFRVIANLTKEVVHMAETLNCNDLKPCLS